MAESRDRASRALNAGVGILDLIDAAIDDYTLGPDAVRYSAAPRKSGLVLGHPATVRFGDGPPIPVVSVSVEERFTALGVSFAQAAEGFRLLSQVLASFSIPLQRREEAAPSRGPGTFGHALLTHVTRAFRVTPGMLGVYGGCACHPGPNAAARDYRRRTKHRRRRMR